MRNCVFLAQIQLIVLIFGRIHQILNITKSKKRKKRKNQSNLFFKNQFLFKNRKKFPFLNKKKDLKKKTSSTHTCQGIGRYSVATMLRVYVYVHKYILYSMYILYGMYTATVHCFLSFDCNCFPFSYEASSRHDRDRRPPTRFGQRRVKHINRIAAPLTEDLSSSDAT